MIAVAVREARRRVRVEGLTAKYLDPTDNAWRILEDCPSVAYARGLARGARIAVALAGLGFDEDAICRIVAETPRAGRWEDAVKRAYSSARLIRFLSNCH